MLKKIVLSLLLVVLSVTSYLVYKHHEVFTFDQLKARYANQQSRFLHLEDGTRVHYQIHNEQAQTTLVLIHGSNMSVQVWDAWVQYLPSRYRLLSFDMPGHGLTGRIVSDDYTAISMAGVLHQSLQQLGIKQAFVAGNSMGGRVAWNYGLTYPDNTAGIILVDASGFPDINKQSSVFDLINLPIIRNLDRLTIPRSILKQGLVTSVVETSVFSASDIDMYWQFNLMAGTGEATAKRFKQPPVTPHQSIANIQVPTLILWGDKDPLIPVTDAQKFNSSIAGSEMIIYNDVGHIPQLEIPQDSAADVVRFIDSQLIRQVVSKQPI